MYAWENSFLSRVTQLRNKEIKYIMGVLISYGLMCISWEILPFFILLTTFLTFIYMDNSNIITAERAFVSITLFNLMRYPMMVLPWSVTESVNAFVSLKRLGEYLMGEELSHENRNHLDDSFDDKDKTAIEIIDGSFLWKENDKIILDRINLEIHKGKLIAIVGKVGCGKSSLISALLGEMHQIAGSVKVKGKIAYVSQEAWIQNKSLKENILLTQNYDKEFYDNVIKACALTTDLEQLPGGDETEIGERGINLSGGQKQRISLARAVYQNRDIYLLDDPLSAVDAHVGQHLFKKVISNKGILKGKTRILVTNALNWLSKVDEVFVLNENGCILQNGSFKTILESGDFLHLLQKDTGDNKTKLENVVKANIEDGESVNNEHSPPYLQTQTTRRKSCSLSLKNIHVDYDKMVYQQQKHSISSHNETDVFEKSVDRLTEEEEAVHGTVRWTTYWFYIKSGGVTLFTTSFFMYIVFTGLQIFSNAWIEQFTEDKEIQETIFFNFTNRSDEIRRNRTTYYMIRYVLIGLGMTFVLCLNWICSVAASIKASKNVHKRLLRTVLRSPMEFFDTTLSGRILNRFSKDMEIMDHSVLEYLSDSVFSLWCFVGSIVIISYVTPWYITVIIPLIIIYYFLQLYYMPTSRQSRRLDSIATSPVFNHFTETLQGVASIRAFGEQIYFQTLNQDLIDVSSKYKFIQIASVQWLSLRTQALGNLIVFLSILFSIAAREYLTAGLIGLSISYSLQITDTLNSLLSSYTNLETNFVALERINQYCQIPSEADSEMDKKLPNSWPNTGNVNFENYDLRYRDGLPLALKNINLCLKGGEKIGIVGRTGAGKSSLSYGLLRLVESAGGLIKIDGIDISTIGLHDLRKSLTILPQDPVVFSGSLRDNLDPFNVHSDAKLIQSLETAHLKQWVVTLIEGMDYDCGEGGANLSVGQKQLLCLARALLRKSKVLILDEATASVDVETDKLVMETIREYFRHSTVIIIAHRISTVLDTNKIVVMDGGKIIEMDTPQNLLSIPNGVFKSLYEQSLSDNS